jgi:hypothetical protein
LHHNYPDNQKLEKMKFLNFKFLATVFIAFISFLSSAQPIDPPADNDPPGTPINMQLIWLAVVGVAFMFYFLKNRKIAN